MNNTKKTMPEHLLTELQRQDVYLGELPDGYEFPVFSGKQAVESQRKSNYKTTAHAAREIVDNALEAGSSTVWIALQRVDEARRKKHQPRDTVTGVAFIDDGPGMKPNMARLALSWGGGTHAKEPNFIGKFGFGLPNSSINQTRRVEVYTKTAADRSWSMTYLDIHEVPQFGKVTVPEPVEAELPRFVLDYIERKKLTLDSGTIVAWVNPDRLSHSTSSNLRKALIEDFGVTYRYLLDEFSIIVEDVLVKPVDPLFLMEESLFFVPEEEGGAKCTFERELPVRYWRDRGTGAPRLEILEDSSAFYKRDDLHEDRLDVAIGSVRVRVARFPVGFVQGAKGASGDP
ncbi:MAG: ATP-binding protein, partial [Myxococcota bacterium]|nr:ATP-binding protein [Myxococcota bacterium]